MLGEMIKLITELDVFTILQTRLIPGSSSYPTLLFLSRCLFSFARCFVFIDNLLFIVKCFHRSFGCSYRKVLLCLGQNTLVKEIPDLIVTDLDKYGSNQSLLFHQADIPYADVVRLLRDG